MKLKTKGHYNTGCFLFKEKKEKVRESLTTLLKMKAIVRPKLFWDFLHCCHSSCYIENVYPKSHRNRDGGTLKKDKHSKKLTFNMFLQI